VIGFVDRHGGEWVVFWHTGGVPGLFSDARGVKAGSTLRNSPAEAARR
jgi:hypothetical protein